MKRNNNFLLLGVLLAAQIPAFNASALRVLEKAPEGVEQDQYNVNLSFEKFSKISPELERLAVNQQSIDVVVELNSKEYRQLVAEMAAAVENANAKYSDKIRELTQYYRPKGEFKSKEEEREALAQYQENMPFFVQESVNKINLEREAEKNAVKQEYRHRIKDILSQQNAEFDDFIQFVGGKVSEFITVNNSVALTIPSTVLKEVAEHPSVIKINEDNPGKPELESQIISLGVNAFWNDGDNGGIWDAGILDSGVEETHDALASHTFLENYATNGSHGTGVACMYGSTDATDRGLAFGLDKFLVDNAGSSSTSMAGADWMVTAAADDPEVINYSWGNGLATGVAWGNMARFVDGVVNNHSVVWVKSAGNEGYDDDPTMTQPGENYNGITVANMFDQNTDTRSDDVIWWSSSRGPTADGRRKPDLSAPGHSTTTCGLNNTFTTLGGTSSAAPKVGAGALLLQDAGHYYPISIKATLINAADSWEDNDTQTTADDGAVSGKEWNRTYGWGYLDLWHANFHKDDYFIDTIAPNGSAGDHQFYVGQGWVGDKATAVWERDVDYNDDSTPTAYRSLSDINMRLYDEQSHTLEDTDFSAKDNVHQVAVESSGKKVIKVYSWNSQVNERVAVATEEGFSRAAPPSFSQVKQWQSIGFGNWYRVSTDISNNGDLKAHNVSATLVNLPAGVSLMGAASRSVEGIDAGASTAVVWYVATDNEKLLNDIQYRVNSDSYGESYTHTTR